jgi:hypothetical protein
MNGTRERRNDSDEQPARGNTEGQSRNLSLCRFEKRNGTGILFKQFSERNTASVTDKSLNRFFHEPMTEIDNVPRWQNS